MLPADSSYRVISRLLNWDPAVTAATYRLQVKRLSAPAGCPVITPGAYNAAPAGALGGNRCRILDIPAAGVYRLKAVDEANYEIYAQVNDTAGVKVCGSQRCEFPAAGRYTMVLAGSAPRAVLDFPYYVALLPLLPTGCQQVTDDPANLTFHRGEFRTAGQHDCVQLASPAGTRILELLPGDAAGAAWPDVTVVDATGAYVCDSNCGLRAAGCGSIPAS